MDFQVGDIVRVVKLEGEVWNERHEKCNGMTGVILFIYLRANITPPIYYIGPPDSNPNSPLFKLGWSAEALCLLTPKEETLQPPERDTSFTFQEGNQSEKQGSYDGITVGVLLVVRGQIMITEPLVPGD